MSICYIEGQRLSQCNNPFPVYMEEDEKDFTRLKTQKKEMVESMSNLKLAEEEHNAFVNVEFEYLVRFKIMKITNHLIQKYN